MAAFQTACWIRTLLLVGFVSSVSAGQKNITAEPGQTITLPCGAPDNRPVIVVEWSRTDLGSDYVLFFRDHQIDPELQHPSFKDRVDLQDRQMKDGDVSLVLKDVTTEDTGTYECRVDYSKSNRRKRDVQDNKPINITHLQIDPPPDQKNITAEPGQTITLPCGAPDNRPVRVVEWSRTGLGSDYVLLFRDDQSDPELQHPSFKDRVDLQDRQMKDGDVSLLLKNVTTEDTGTYECRVLQKEDRQRKLISTINLQVSPPGGQDQQTGGGGNQAGGAGGGGNQGGGAGGLTAALVVLAVALVIILAVIPVIVWKKKNSSPPPPPPPPDEEAVELQML